MPSANDLEEIRHLTAVCERRDALYFVWIAYYPDDAANAVGQIVAAPHERGGQSRCVINTNDFLSPLWRSPAEHLWIGSANGNLWTTAPVAWPPARFEGLTFTSYDPALAWSVTTLPDMRRLGYAPNVTALWGSADDDVHAGTFKGVMYRWDGNAWGEVYDAKDAAVNRMHGIDANDVYAVGYDGLILHWDGKAWQPIAYPGGRGAGEVLTGVRVVADGEVYICSRSGRVLRGGTDGFEIFCELPLSLYGIAHFEDRLILAAGDGGVFELIGDQAIALKETFGCVDLYETSARLFCVEPTQQVPSIIDFTPGAEPPWARRSFG